MGRRILTNNFNLPETLVKAVQYDTHKLAGTISVTELIDAPQIRVLKKKFDYEVDVVDNLYALIGTALHHILERANIDSVRKRAFILVAETLEAKSIEYLNQKMETEAIQCDKVGKWLKAVIPVFFPEVAQRYLWEVTQRLDLGSGHVLSGTFDLYDKETGILWDYKFCSTYMWTYPEARQKWIEQLNIYAFMLRQNLGLNITGIRVVAFFRDWSHYKLMKDKDYPDMQIKELYIPLFDTPNVINLINHHLMLHLQAESGDVPECTGEMRWAKAGEYAVKNPDSKRAIRVLDTPQAAKQYILENGHRIHGMFIEERPGESTRCEKYCPVRHVCPQRKAELKKIELLKAS